MIPSNNVFYVYLDSRNLPRFRPATFNWYYRKCDFTHFKLEYNLNPIPNNSKILFLKNASTPKFKLETTPFKRAIKPETADCIVCGKLIEKIDNYSNPSRWIIKDQDKYFILPIWEFVSLNLTSIDQTINYLKSKNAFTDNCEIIPLEDFHIYENPKHVNFEYLENPKFTGKIYLDETLNSQISKNGVILTDDVYESIYNMLLSTDSSIMDLGLKTLAETNYTLCPWKTKYLLCCNSTIDRCKAWTSTTVKALKQGINIHNWISQQSVINSLVRSVSDSEVITDMDKTFFKQLLIKDVSKMLKSCNLNNYKAFGITVNANICVDGDKIDMQLED